MLVTINNVTFRLAIHLLDGEISEVYAFHDDLEIFMAYDLNDMYLKLRTYSWAYTDTPNYKPSELHHV